MAGASAVTSDHLGHITDFIPTSAHGGFDLDANVVARSAGTGDFGIHLCRRREPG
jgi:hypothetical protein